MGCQCCDVRDISITVNGTNVAPYSERISVDVSQDLLWEYNTDKNCKVIPDNYLYLWGQGRTTVQLTCYPWDCTTPDPYFDMMCPVSLNVSVPWKWVYDCRLTADCYDPTDPRKTLKRKGKWIAIPMRKKQITATNDVSGSSLFDVSDCSFALPKFDVQAGQRSYVSQFAHQYVFLAYKGSPICFSTKDDGYFKLSVKTSNECLGLNEVDAYLTNFQFTFNPPKPPTVIYSFEVACAPCPLCG